MKAVLILALAVAVSAEADPLFYNYGYATPLVHTTPYMYKPLGYHAYSPGVSHSVLAKREAEAEPFYYGYPYTGYTGHVYSHGVYAPYGVKAPTYSNDAVSPYGYAAKGRYFAQSAGVTHIAKREADPYMLYNYMPSVYSTGYHYATPYVHHTPYVTGMKTYSNDAVSPWNYAAKGKYHADSLGAKHIAKREAEPFYGYYGYPSTYAGYNAGHTFVTSPYSYIKYFH